MVHGLETIIRLNEERTSPAEAAKCQRMEESLDMWFGNRESLRKLLEDPATILERICETAEHEASRRGVEPWVVISEWTGHGSGVSAAIYHLYCRREGCE